ncbi:MAG TPA: mannose-1-phosphate guanylyltransferase/mannose-6-phosphate isomerase [Methanomicrobiales archaeon]|jgi:mannose-1-phosphate guanylyltransferase/mannose-6-phosphate isomerase|nr:mannose-1-phosphate guanylyltransferase/mannose-6-phosphate isomerase [Methanomicrobiales archaeon]
MHPIHSIILAGGVGSRLWPLSRQYYPKQFLCLGTRSLFQETYERARLLSGDEGITVVTNAIHQYLVMNQLEEIGCAIGKDRLLLEPAGRNTLPAIAWAMQRDRAQGRNVTAAVFPSDHLIEGSVVGEIRAAAGLARDHLVTFGVTPTKTYTGYGYIRPGEDLKGGYRVSEFREKPDEATAARLIAEGCLWNSGIFLLSPPCFFAELSKHQPEMAEAFAGGDLDYGALPPLSMDYGLLERSDRVAVVPLRAAWDDLGDFGALYEHEPHDRAGNAGKAEFIDAHGNYVHAGEKHVGIIAADDLVVVDTPDALLVCGRGETARVRELVERYDRKHDPIVQFHLQVHRPWGSYTILEEAGSSKIKRVSVRPGKRLSLQLHRHRSEHWIVVSGIAEIQLGEERFILSPNESTFVRAGVRHRLGNPGKVPLEVIEVQSGDYLGEDDIVRFDDEYGRE